MCLNLNKNHKLVREKYTGSKVSFDNPRRIQWSGRYVPMRYASATLSALATAVALLYFVILTAKK